MGGSKIMPWAANHVRDLYVNEEPRKNPKQFSSSVVLAPLSNPSEVVANGLPVFSGERARKRESE